MMKQIKLEEGIRLVVDNRGKTPAKLNGEFTDEGYRVISALNVHNGVIDNQDSIRCVNEELYFKWQQIPIERDDCFIASEGASLGESAIWDSDEKVVLGQRLYAIRLNKDIIDPWYFAFYMQTQLFRNQVVNTSTGSTVFGISQPVLLGLKIFVPDIQNQRKIGLLYKNIYRQIKRNNEMVQKLQVLSQAIFNKWFVQFDYPEFEGEMQYNPILKKDIPLGWTACKLTECIKWESSSQPPKSTFSDVPKIGYIRFIQNRDYDSQNHITYIPLKNTTKTCSKYDIMMDKYGDAGRIRCGLEGAYNVALAKITPTIQSSQEYIRQFLQRETNYEYLHNACMASTRASLNEQTLSGIVIPVPPQKVLSKFESIMKKIISYRFAITDLTNELIFIKEKLLPLLINGQLE